MEMIVSCMLDSFLFGHINSIGSSARPHGMRCYSHRRLYILHDDCFFHSDAMRMCVCDASICLHYVHMHIVRARTIQFQLQHYVKNARNYVWNCGGSGRSCRFYFTFLFVFRLFSRLRLWMSTVDTYSRHTTPAISESAWICHDVVCVCMHFRTRACSRTHSPENKITVNIRFSWVYNTHEKAFTVWFSDLFSGFTNAPSSSSPSRLLVAVVSMLAVDDLRFKNVFRSQNLVVAWIAYFSSANKKTKFDSTIHYTHIY